jgi:hypothetical protein
MVTTWLQLSYSNKSDHFGSYVRSLSIHFCKRLFPGLVSCYFFFANLLVVTKGWAEKIIAMGLFLHMYACAFALFIQAKNKCPLILQHVSTAESLTPNS